MTQSLRASCAPFLANDRRNQALSTPHSLLAARIFANSNRPAPHQASGDPLVPPRSLSSFFSPPPPDPSAMELCTISSRSKRGAVKSFVVTPPPFAITSHRLTSPEERRWSRGGDRAGRQAPGSDASIVCSQHTAASEYIPDRCHRSW